jgi:hypothetical protein
MGQWSRGDTIKLMTFHAETVMESPAYFKSVIRRKIGYE